MKVSDILGMQGNGGLRKGIRSWGILEWARGSGCETTSSFTTTALTTSVIPPGHSMSVLPLSTRSLLPSSLSATARCSDTEAAAKYAKA